MGVDVFVKIGGSVLDDLIATKSLMDALLAVADNVAVVALPGGGAAAKRMKQAQRDLQLRFETCWLTGFKIVDTNALFLSSFSNKLHYAASMQAVRPQAGRLTILSPYEFARSDPTFERSWDITTDSMGCYFAHTLGATRYVIVTNVDGIFDFRGPAGTPPSLFSTITSQTLSELPISKLDSLFPSYIRKYPVPCKIVNGLIPARVLDCVLDRSCIGTEVLV